MLDHIGLVVEDFSRSRAFFVAALAPLEIELLYEFTAEQTGRYAQGGFGADAKPYFWIGEGARPSGTTHVAFAAKSRVEVRAFHDAAMRAAGRDNGGPGMRPEYHPDYYAAFVLDPDGNNIEAVCHAPE